MYVALLSMQWLFYAFSLLLHYTTYTKFTFVNRKSFRITNHARKSYIRGKQKTTLS